LVAPIVVLLIATPAADPGLAQALVESCSRAAQPAGCVLGDPAAPGVVGPRVLVSVYDQGARARAELFDATPGVADAAHSARDVEFRERDPAPERFRALGLVVAGLAGAGGDLAASPEPRPLDAGAPALDAAHAADAAEADGSPVWSLAAVLALDPIRPRAGIWAGADIPWAGSIVFGRVDVAYEQTLRRDASGIGEQRERVGLGAGLRWPPAAGAWALRVPVELALENLSVSIVQPGTGRQGSGGRVVLGAGTGAELSLLLARRTAVFVAGRASLLEGQTMVQVAGAPTTTIPAWEASVAVGLNVRIP
jgi:hypothetical protein